MPQNDFLTSLSPNTTTISTARGDVRMFIVYKGDTLQIPVNPDSLIVKTPNKNRAVPIVSLGEVNILKEPGLTSFSFKSFFPVASTQNYPYVLTGNSEATFYTGLIKQILGRQNKTQFITPEQYIKIFKEIKSNKEPVRFIVLGLPETINELVSIEKFDYRWEEGDYDVNYDIELKLYRLYAIRECTYDAETGTVTVDEGQNRIDESDALLAPYSGCKVNVTGNIYKDPAMQFVDRYVKNLLGVYVGLVDFDNNGAIHIRDDENTWIGWVSEQSINKATGML